jgi:aldose 1-epimerase
LRPEIAAAGIRITFDLDLGGRADSWTIRRDGHPMELLTRHSDAPIDHGMYAMAPWAGRIRNNAVGEHRMEPTFGPWAIHGTAPWRPATVLQSTAASITLKQDLGAWPFAGSVETHWAITETTVQTNITVSSERDEFPATVGWHPWFPRELHGAQARVDLPATDQLVRGEDALPTGERIPYQPIPGTFDDAFLVPSQQATITWPDVARVHVTSSEPWFVLFDQLPDAVCIEPQSGPPDGLRSSAYWEPFLVTPNRPLALSTTWTVELL